MVCPKCGMIREDERGRCWNCEADFHGHVHGKRAVQPRELMAKMAKRCPHDIFLHQPCPKCDRSTDDCEVYRRATLVRIQEVLVSIYGLSRPTAWESAKAVLAAADAKAAQQAK